MTTFSRQFATSFNSIAAEYAAARPTYPPALYDTIEELTGRPLAGSHVLDVGAGTGIATRALHERGARVTAAEPGAGMAAQFRAGLPTVPLVRAGGDALPFAAASFDLVTYAQAWHWTEPARSVPEALRALRPGGALALWWNTPDRGVPWIEAQERRLRERLPDYHQYDITARAPVLIRRVRPELAPAYREVRWSRTIPLAAHLANLATHSYFAVLGPEATRPILAAEEDILAAEFPDGLVEECYTVRLTLVRR
ncbi:class I SAM-dependent methyltransferase [Streptomyces litchfieldiae]|uniref:Class I SAM-dependent methyltransferase n=1 Tax=Streptomyces litchfieldiae TaxID=3075543 RepID=A0ABU2MJZ9_9ACTN|nr:class I SAM-dependent methyltransferase [Streptomyces sp. DSM 44938]MDT0341698.1 class I SAM-dependent methyltransferase [Streptomyces sp. DSM 44938]